MKEKKATIYEVAKQADVSTATVSRVLNDSPNVSEKTKKNVLKVIDDLNYSPQLMARKLASREPQILAIVVPSFTTPYFNEVLKGIKDKIKRIDLDIILFNTGSKNPESGMQRFFDRGMADAAIILSIDINDKVHQQLQAMQTPTVLVNSTHEAYSHYGINDYHGGYVAGDHLAQQGFKKIGLISAFDDTKSSNKRKQGFVDALKKHDIAINEDYFVKGDSKKHGGFTEEAGFEAIQKLDKKGDFPDAIFCLNDTQAVGAIYALSKLDMNVPDDIAIMGYDNIKMSKYLGLTTVDQKMYTIGVEAITCLAETIEHPGEPLHQMAIDPVLIERGSTIPKKQSG